MAENKNKKKVSIVLPVYNGESNVDKAIVSVLGQTYSNLELIIVNDCSVDATSEILEKYQKQDSRIKIINNSTNLKLPRTLNVGFGQASGDYYTWTSDDNLYKENAIEKMVEVLERNPDFDMVYANYTNIDVNDHIIKEIHLAEPEHLLIGNAVGACFLYTKEIAEKVGEYDPNLFLAEDYDYWIRIWRVGKILHIEDNLYCYRLHAGSLTETKKKWIGVQTYKAMEKNFLFMYSMAKTKQERYAFLDQLIIRLGENDSTEVRSMFYNIDKGYIWHERKKKMKEKIRDSIVWRVMCRCIMVKMKS